MKTTTSTYQEKEVSNETQTVELYKVWTSLQTWYYTNYTSDIVYDGNTYSMAAIERGSLEFDTGINQSKMNIKFGMGEDSPIPSFIIQNPVDTVWVEVQRLHIDLDPLESSVVFIGEVKNVSFLGNTGEVNCVGFDHYISKGIPNEFFQKNCNHFLYDENCGIDPDNYKQTITITGIDGLVITASGMTTKAVDFYKYGKIEFEGHRRMIVAYDGGTSFTLRYRIPSLEVGDIAIIYAGCDYTGATCKEKFDNIDNFLGFEFIPFDNPVTWT